MKRHKWITHAAAIWFLLASVAHGAEPRRSFDIGNLHVERFGESGPAVILIPGLASGSWVWADVIAALKSNYRIYAVTLAGFDGVADIKGDRLALTDRALNGLIASEHLYKPILVGHSLGGTLALRYATAHSAQIAGVVAVDGLPVFPGTESVPLPQRAAMAQTAAAQVAGTSQEEFRTRQKEYMQHIGVISADRAAALANLTSRSDREATAEYTAADLSLDFRPQLKSIQVPVLEISPYLASDFAAIHLSEDAKVDYYRSLLSGVTRLEVESISPARHFAMVDQPVLFLKLLRQFLITNGVKRGDL
jgi:pimeloyl-ACP methyl ester carboxylesterase